MNEYVITVHTMSTYLKLEMLWKVCFRACTLLFFKAITVWEDTICQLVSVMLLCSRTMAASSIIRSLKTLMLKPYLIMSECCFELLHDNLLLSSLSYLHHKKFVFFFSSLPFCLLCMWGRSVSLYMWGRGAYSCIWEKFVLCAYTYACVYAHICACICDSVLACL